MATTENVTGAVLAGTDSSSSNTGSGISGGEGLTMVSDRVIGNTKGDFHLFPDTLICILKSSVLRTRNRTTSTGT